MDVRTVLINRITLILFLTLCVARVIGDINAKTSAKLKNQFIDGSKFRFITFNPKDAEIDISWEISVPFFTIPLHPINGNGGASPLVNVNKKGFLTAGLFTAILTLIVPLLSKPGPEMHYRSDSRWSRMGNTINEIVLGNSYVIPCIQRTVCSIVSEASHTDNPTSTEKIIDGLSSHKWFKEFMNGTVLQDAIRIGREGNRDCGQAYKDCFVTPRILENMMAQFGTI